MEDTAILELFLARDEKAIAEIKQKYGTYCGYIAGQILGNEQDAEECVNDALAAAWNSIPPQEPENLKTYVGKLTREISISRYRREHAQKRFNGEYAVSLEELEEVLSGGDLAEEMEAKELAGRISVFLRTRPERERNVFVRRYYYNDPIKEICRRYGLGESKVKVTLKRTRDRLAEFLRKEGLL